MNDGGTTNVCRPRFDEPRDQPGFTCLRARVGRQAGADRLGASLWEIPAGQAAYPYHHHLVEEELLIVLSGRPRLRTPEGWRDLREGEVVSFRAGEKGGHQVVNHTDATVRALVLSTSGEPDLVVYPDSGKLGVFDRRLSQEKPLWALFRLDDAVDYWDAEAPPASPEPA